jgi:YQGE family putative transporter
MNSIGRYDEDGKIRIEMVIARELAITVGRILGIGGLFALFLWKGDNTPWLHGYIGLLLLIGLIPAWLAGKMNNKEI